MTLPSCRRCGRIDRDRMIGLMTLWFGPLVEIEPGHGYFHLCPACFEETVAPELEAIQRTLSRLNPSAAAFLEREQARDLGRDGDEGSDEGAGPEDAADAN